MTVDPARNGGATGKGQVERGRGVWGGAGGVWRQDHEKAFGKSLRTGGGSENGASSAVASVTFHHHSEISLSRGDRQNSCSINYSARKACTGSTFEARAAGSHTASSAMAVRMSGAETNTAGSQGLTANSEAAKRRHCCVLRSYPSRIKPVQNQAGLGSSRARIMPG